MAAPAPPPADGEPDGTAVGAVEPLGAGDADAAAPPSASIAAAEPGAMFDSPGSKRSTAKRLGAFGSAGGAVGTGVGDPPAVADGGGDGPRRPAGAAAGVAAVRRRGRRRLRVDRDRRVDAELVGLAELHARRAGGAGRQLDDRAVGPGDLEPGRTGRDRQRHGVAGRDGLGRGGRAAHQLAGEIGEQDRERDLEGQVGLARLEGQDRRPPALALPGVQERRAAGTRDDGPRPGRQRELRRRPDVGRREVHVAEDRLVRVERPDPRVLERPDDLAERARRLRRDREDRRRGQLVRNRALEDDQVEQLGVRAGAVVLRPPPRRARCSGRKVSAVSRYGSPSETRRTRRSRSGGTIAQARSSSASESPAPSASPSRRTSTTRTPTGMSSMIASDRVCGSRTMSRASMSTPSPYSWSRRWDDSMSRFAMLTKTDRVTPDEPPRTASATIAWFLRSRPDLEDGDRVLQRRRRRPCERRVRGHEDLRVPGPCRERIGEVERVAQVAGRRRDG